MAKEKKRRLHASFTANGPYWEPPESTRSGKRNKDGAPDSAVPNVSGLEASMETPMQHAAPPPGNAEESEELAKVSRCGMT